MTTPRFRSISRASRASRAGAAVLLLPCALLLASPTALAQGPAGVTLPPPSPPPPDAPPFPAPGPEDFPDAPPTPPPPPPSEATPPTTDPPADPAADPKSEGHRGFVFGFSVGYALPAGNATGIGSDSLASSFSGQVPLTLDLGGNITPSFYAGAYGTFAPGGLAGTASSECSQYQLQCSAYSAHVGLAVRYRFLPGQPVEPWIGYAIGYESNNFSLVNPQSSATASGSITGWEFGRFSVGVDFLPAGAFAFGPFIDVALGQYGHEHMEETNQPTLDSDITMTSLHEWITIGVRAVVMP